MQIKKIILLAGCLLFLTPACSKDPSTQAQANNSDDNDDHGDSDDKDRDSNRKDSDKYGPSSDPIDVVDPDDTNHTGCFCDPGDFVKCEVKGIQGIRECNDDCQWDPCSVSINEDTETDDEEPIFLPPEEHCPKGYLELNIKDFFSADATPHLVRAGEEGGSLLPFDTLAHSVRVMTDIQGSIVYGARPHPSNCNYYRTCIPKGTKELHLEPSNPRTACGTGNLKSTPLDISGVSDGDYLTMYYEGTNEELTHDYYNAYYIDEEHRFSFSQEPPEVLVEYGPLEEAPSCVDTSDFVTVHFRWPWGNPDTNGFAGTGCEQDQAGINTSGEVGEREYPSSLMVALDTCPNAVAVLERSDGFCPWYTVLIPKADWTPGNSMQFKYDNESGLIVNSMDIPDEEGDEFWVVYEGPKDDAISEQGTPCNNFSYRQTMYHIYTANLGPNYPGCGGAEPPDDCADVKPIGSSVVHFRYLWAGRKTFTYFPKDEFMPSSIFLQVNQTEYPCVQEGGSPWFRCPIPNDEFYEGATWRAVDKNHSPEWNTVGEEPSFPAKPGAAWIRWWDGKPDINSQSEYAVTDYYPDGVEWAKAGSWGDDFCFTKDDSGQTTRPPIVTEGYFPWDETRYAYPNGQSIAKWYDRHWAIQDLLNYFVWERYQLWKEKYVRYDDDACGEGTARVDSSDSVSPTVSEGMGYGMAITAAIGDKTLFDKLWRFVNHFLTQTADKYCGGLAGWNWQGPQDCQPYGVPWDVERGEKGQDSAFDGDVDIAMGLVHAAWQWEEYTEDTVDWLLKMECEINDKYGDGWYYPTPGDTWDKNCGNYPGEPCDYTPGTNGNVNMSYYPPGYFRAFGEFLMANMDPKKYSASERRSHRDFWYKTAETVWEMTERCYDQDDVHPALSQDFGFYETPCSRPTDNYNWSRALWRLGVDASWYGEDEGFNSTHGKSSYHYDGKSQVQAKMDLIQNFYAHEFPVDNPVEPNANRFSTICRFLTPNGEAGLEMDGGMQPCDPAYDHNSYFVGTAMTSFVSFYDNDGKTTTDIRKEALEEAISVNIEDDNYYQESIGVLTSLFITGNYPKPYSPLSINVELE
ncbi:MAG: hypothetical protein JXR76_12440 [Deltaproteobacteria bacterium]|nr:hypothetical protein [Deltaproteobacteria bacterium]